MARSAVGVVTERLGEAGTPASTAEGITLIGNVDVAVGTPLLVNTSLLADTSLPVGTSLLAGTSLLVGTSLLGTTDAGITLRVVLDGAALVDEMAPVGDVGAAANVVVVNNATDDDGFVAPGMDECGSAVVTVGGGGVLTTFAVDDWGGAVDVDVVDVVDVVELLAGLADSATIVRIRFADVVA